MSKETRTGRPRHLTPEEADLWRRAMDSVKPLKKRRDPAPANAAPPSAAELPAAKSAVRPRPAVPRKPPAPPPSVVPPDLVPGRPAGVDRRTATRLRRGKLSVEARIDLHGHTQEQAHRALRGFLMASVDAGRRCVLVITGKGSRGERDGVIRSAVPHWLNLAPLRDHVLAIQPARPQDGGDGALYVLLRRKRAARQAPP